MYEILGLKYVFSTFQETLWNHFKRNVNCAIIEMIARQHALTVQELYFAAPQ